MPIKPHLELVLMRCCIALLCVVSAVLLAGCQDDEIRRYQVPKPETLPQGPSHVEKTVRLLAAIIPRGDKTWFVKLAGPTATVQTSEAEFDRFIQSMHFKDQDREPVQWTTPEGWKSAPAVPGRHATFYLGPRDSPLEVTVHALGAEAKDVLANVNRWRKLELGLGPIRDDKLEEVTKPLKVDGVAATRVDMMGPGTGKSKKKTPFLRDHPVVADGDAGQPVLNFKAPEGWKEKKPDASVGQMAAFQVVEGSATADVSITPAGGSLLANVNRWRSQIGLDPVDGDQLKKQFRETEVAGVAGAFIELVGPASAGAARQSILGVIFLRGQQAWFIKMKGPADLVAKQKPAFEAFVRSVEFAGNRGGKDE